jgi:hypothetical protein
VILPECRSITTAFMVTVSGCRLDTSDTLDTRSGNSSYKPSIEDFSKPLSCPSKVSSQVLTPGNVARQGKSDIWVI